MERFPATYFQDILPAGSGADYFAPVWDGAVKLAGRPARILDLGCGTGAFGLYGKQLTGAYLIGVDGSDFAIAQARAAGYDEVHQVRDLDRSVLPLTENSVDFCLCKDVLEHLLDPEHALREVSRVVAPRGFLLVHVPNHFTLLGRWRLLTRNNIDTYGYFPDAKRWAYPHIRFFDRASLDALLSLCGFETIAELSQHFPSVPGGRFLVPIAAWRRAMAKRWPDTFAEGYSVLARKVRG